MASFLKYEMHDGFRSFELRRIPNEMVIFSGVNDVFDDDARTEGFGLIFFEKLFLPFFRTRADQNFCPCLNQPVIRHL